MVQGHPIPWFQPAASVINSKWAKGISPAAIASAASLPEGGWWTQARLAARGLASHPFCTKCQGMVGTLSHRMFRCSARKEQIESHCPKWLQESANQEPDNPLFALGVLARPLSQNHLRPLRIGSANAQLEGPLLMVSRTPMVP